MWSRAELARDFACARRASEGDVVMLHASVRSVGEVAGGPDQIHLALSRCPRCERYPDDVRRVSRVTTTTSAVGF